MVHINCSCCGRCYVRLVSGACGPCLMGFGPRSTGSGRGWYRGSAVVPVTRHLHRWFVFVVLASLVACFQSSPPEGNPLDPVPDVSSREVISQSLALGSGVGEFGKVRVGQANRLDWHTVSL